MMLAGIYIYMNDFLVIFVIYRYYLYACESFTYYLFLEKHIDLILALLHHVRDDNLA